METDAKEATVAAKTVEAQASLPAEGTNLEAAKSPLSEIETDQAKMVVETKMDVRAIPLPNADVPQSTSSALNKAEVPGAPASPTASSMPTESSADPLTSTVTGKVFTQPIVQGAPIPVPPAATTSEAPKPLHAQVANDQEGAAVIHSCRFFFQYAVKYWDGKSSHCASYARRCPGRVADKIKSGILVFASTDESAEDRGGSENIQIFISSRSWF